MATISFSRSVRRYLAQDVFSQITTMKLMEGPVPADFSELLTTSSFNDRLLVEFSSIYDTYDTSLVGRKLYTNSYYTALKSGTATWLWGYSSALGFQFVATVGTENSDIIISNTAIIAGGQYRLSDITFEFPENYTY